MKICPSFFVRYLLAWSCVRLRYARKESFVHGCSDSACDSTAVCVWYKGIFSWKPFEVRGSLCVSKLKIAETMPWCFLRYLNGPCVSICLSADYTKCSLECL